MIYLAALIVLILSGCIWALYDRVLELEDDNTATNAEFENIGEDIFRVENKLCKFQDKTAKDLEKLFLQQQANNALPKLHTARGKDGRFVRK